MNKPSTFSTAKKGSSSLRQSQPWQYYVTCWFCDQRQSSGRADTSFVNHSWLSKGVAGYSDLMGTQAVSLLLLLTFIVIYISIFYFSFKIHYLIRCQSRQVWVCKVVVSTAKHRQFGLLLGTEESTHKLQIMRIPWQWWLGWRGICHHS